MNDIMQKHFEAFEERMNPKPKVEKIPFQGLETAFDKCLTPGCDNHKDQGEFEGDFCIPCYQKGHSLNHKILNPHEGDLFYNDLFKQDYCYVDDEWVEVSTNLDTTSVTSWGDGSNAISGLSPAGVWVDDNIGSTVEANRVVDDHIKEYIAEQLEILENRMRGIK